MRRWGRGVLRPTAAEDLESFAAKRRTDQGNSINADGGEGILQLWVFDHYAAQFPPRVLVLIASGSVSHLGRQKKASRVQGGIVWRA